MSVKIDNFQFEGPYNYDKNFNVTFACVYAVVYQDKLIYVGITDDINERLQNHHKKECWKKHSTAGSLYIHKENNKTSREQIERNILRLFNTNCNDQLN